MLLRSSASAAGGLFVFIWRAMTLTVAIAVIGICLAYGLTLAVVAAVRLKRLRGKTYQQRKTRLRGHSGTLAQPSDLRKTDPV